MQLKQLHLKNFRCFQETTISFDRSFMVIEGLNGAGKTSLLEALHYMCYLRSFRTHSPRELLRTGEKSFFIKATFSSTGPEPEADQEIQVGFSGNKRLVKINQKTIGSYKELLDYYRIITLTEDDIALIKDGPDTRRMFLDQALLLDNADSIHHMRLIRTIADNRNSIIATSRNRELYDVLTEQLWHASHTLQSLRLGLLKKLEQAIHEILANSFAHESLHISLEYKPKLMKLEQDFASFCQDNESLYMQEQRYGRSLFGAHLDDFIINFSHRHSKNFASRGQQKLIIVLLKVAQIGQLLAHKGPVIFLLDDFMTDFDENRAETILSVLASLNIQLIFTAPARQGVFGENLQKLGAHRILLTH